MSINSPLVIYTISTILITSAAIYHAIITKEQFYSILIYLTTSKINILILGNLVFWFILVIGNIVSKIFLGKLSQDEISHVYDKAKFGITETALALTIFREELNLKLLGLFLILLVIKVFHWLSYLRVDNMARLEGVSIWKHLRLVSLLGWLIIVDSGLVAIISYILYTSETPSVLILFAFEYMILSITAVTILDKYVLFRLDAHWEGRWNNKSLFLFAIEFTSDLLHLVLYIAFFGVVTMFYGLPIHLMREIYMAVHTLSDRVMKFYAYRKITQNMNERFPLVTPTELANVDNTCIICREDMTVQVRKLPCGHMFHFWCLRRLLETDLRCPTCRTPISLTAPPPTVNIVPNNNIIQGFNPLNNLPNIHINNIAELRNLFTLNNNAAANNMIHTEIPINQGPIPPPLFNGNVPSSVAHLELVMRQSLQLQEQIANTSSYLEQLRSQASSIDVLKKQLIEIVSKLEVER